MKIGVARATLCHTLATPLVNSNNLQVALVRINHFCYRSRLRRFVVNARPSIHIMVLPYGEKKDLLRFLVEGTYLVHEVRHIIYSLRTHAVEKPRSKDGAKVYASLGPSMTTVSEIQKSVLATKKHHLFAYFCLEGTCIYCMHTCTLTRYYSLIFTPKIAYA